MIDIEDYEFGKMVINGNKYTNDVIILPDGKIISWWRKSGHDVVNEDLEKIYQSNPSVIILGTGWSGLMKASPEVAEYCESHSIKLIVDTSEKAVKIYNEDESVDKAAGFHLTC